MSEKEGSGLGLELIELAHALQSVRLVTDLQRTRSFGCPEDALAAIRAASATVTLVAERLRDLGAGLNRESGATAPGDLITAPRRARQRRPR